MNFAFQVFFITCIFSIAILLTAWICQIFKICDEYVLIGSLSAPKIVPNACWMAFSCYAISTIPDGDWIGLVMLEWVFYFILFSELWKLLGVIWDAAKRSGSMRKYYNNFVAHVLENGEKVAQDDFSRGVKSVIETKFSNDDNAAIYFWSKCSKFAKQHGYELR